MRVNGADWNSHRYYAFEHMKDVHGLQHGFNKSSQTVISAWQDAKAQLAQGVTEVYVEGDSEVPSFTVEVAA